MIVDKCVMLREISYFLIIDQPTSSSTKRRRKRSNKEQWFASRRSSCIKEWENLFWIEILLSVAAKSA